MIASKSILSTWRKFDYFPMETLTKVWYYNKVENNRQRPLCLMKEHREEFGITGNCFDLAIWLLDEFRKDGIEAYPIGHNLKSSGAHVAVIALDDHGNRFLCDLGDQWLNPILIDSKNDAFTNEKLSGFFPAAEIQIMSRDSNLEVVYHRPSGKISKQMYDTTPLERDFFMEAAEFSQNLIKPKPLLEFRAPYKNEIAHWEFYDWKSFLSTNEGLFHEEPLESIGEWAGKLNHMTGYKLEFLTEALIKYKNFINLH